MKKLFMYESQQSWMVEIGITGSYYSIEMTADLFPPVVRKFTYNILQFDLSIIWYTYENVLEISKFISFSNILRYEKK